MEQETIKGFPIISVYAPTRDCGVVARIVLVDRGVDGGLGRFVVAWQDTCDTPAGGWQPRWWQPHWRQPRYCPTLAEARNEFMKRAAVADGTAVRIPQEGGRMTMEEEYFAVLGLGTMTAEKHYCTGCGVPANEQCVECGEWRCGVHLHMIGKWCASTAGDRKRGEWCARGRHRVVGPELTCDAKTQRSHGVLCDSGAPRLVRFCHKGMNDHYEAKAHWRCAAHLDASADDGWRWKEETEAKSQPFTAAQLEQMVRQASGYESEIDHVVKPRVTPLVSRSEAKLPDPSTVPAKPGEPFPSGHSNVRLGPKRIIYCSSAPPRELVESAIVRCGTGLEAGKPVMGPLVWSWPRRREWERHVAFAPEGFGTYGGGGLTQTTPGKTISDRDETVDLGTDMFGGQSLAVRCRLCGGWLRSVEVPSWRISAKVPA